MYIIAGLGNPGMRFTATRHNVGFEVIERLAYENNIKLNKKKFNAVLGSGVIGGEKVVLVQPQTYMNLSGESIRPIMDFYKCTEKDLIVVYDDICFEIGTIRIRKKGSAGGHNGMKNIIRHIGTNEFIRVRVGVGAKCPEWDLKDHVLSRFNDEEIKNMVEEIKRASDAIEDIVIKGIDKAMNVYNVKIKREECD
ncbi:aminoacyl-tRNA hydrolase [Vallitalea guaymasensis]|uniref:Peptidyl-tRNA hydrolase n=1 Tax=Vallitalea guaymasensis TaxID=1185412 RepID=A0A8J8MAV5_9FIRM|nr:aminoacyl-tRNA hydrolase [Vallitalea guaymasensis]QUH29579.1 aminoacyl-tRNA hydrolase [Vallitalea guaymasensis]